MLLLITFIVIVVVLIIPVQIAAEWAGARNTDMFSCLVALILAALIQKGITVFAPGAEMHYGLLLTLPLSGLAYTLVLGTTFIRGILIAIGQGVISVLISFLMAGLLLSLV